MAKVEAMSRHFHLVSSASSSTTRWTLWWRRYSTRKQLKALLRDDPDRLMRDLGLHPTAVQAEIDKWFWQR